mmetsp:Transcript_22364/g.48594  ORF Transcript_22364/g.48594 Transcript_22364/m.48594 type:complete len:89 (+) Transcript_22364:77-343(+)
MIASFVDLVSVAKNDHRPLPCFISVHCNANVMCFISSSSIARTDTSISPTSPSTYFHTLVLNWSSPQEATNPTESDPYSQSLAAPRTE